ncbi:MAG: DUF4304 domain-containing protein [Phycisphaeraceae bacterium]|nr:DUF4304 domain-containing protein [Phycisphaeraceae bacterium]MBX3408088.1 DUF4304 domain-containing protein [Phycisphaeraceae bacterium]
MNKSLLVKTLKRVVMPFDYKCKGTLFWRSGRELTTLIQCQASRWGSGHYINFGVTPTAMVTKSYPPSCGYWGLQNRAEDIASPFREEFDRIAIGDQLPRSDRLEAALKWVVEWLEEQFGDSERARGAVLKAFPNEWGILQDWARGQLGPPSTYFSNVRYYRQ